jgi:hypothetical protein
MIETVVYKKIDGSVNIVSSDGNVFSMYKDSFLQMSPCDCRGYKFVRIYINGIRKTRYIHRLVAEAFFSNFNETGLEVNHKDRDKNNNSIENLEMVTKRQNMMHYFSPSGDKKLGAIFHPDKKTRKWQARINHNGKIFSLKYHLTKEEAQEAYRKKFIELYGVEPWQI